MAASPYVFDVTDQTFEKEVLERSLETPVVVDFWAEWCGPCRTLGPLLEAEADARQGAFLLAKVDVDRCQGLAMAFRVQSIPLVVAFKDGKPVNEFMGVVSKPDLVKFIDGLVPSAGDQAASEAEEVEADDPAEAEARYLAVLEEEPGEPIANLGLARLAINREDDEAARKHLDAIDVKKVDEHKDEKQRLEAILELRKLAREAGDPSEVRARHEANPDDAETRYALGVVTAAGGDHAKGLELLLSAAERDKTLAKGAVREAMVHVFYVVGARSDLADEYRDKLEMIFFS